MENQGQTNLRKARFESKIAINPETGCWEWKGAINNKGYGVFWWREKNTGAHRAAWIMYKGEIAEGGNVLHKCNNPPCCNPDHLYIGTHLENAKDREMAGRTSRLGHRYNFKRTPELVAAMSKCLEEGMQVDAMCKHLGISRQTFFRSKEQDPEFLALVKRTKRARYSAGARAREAAR